jgi:enoyl-CoA hydratase/carnithine racemase
MSVLPFARELPNSVAASLDGEIGILRLARADKRNAIDDTMLDGIDTFFRLLPSSIRAVVLHAEGPHFSAGLDLSELTRHTMPEAITHSRNWHRVFHQIEFGRVPVVAVMHGAVVGGGFELAAACHIRVAECSAYYALPEANHGIFFCGGGSVRIARLIGASRMLEMMMTGRTYTAEEGQQLALSHYLMDTTYGLEKALELARRVARNSDMTNFALIHALPRIAAMASESGYMTEALMSSIASGDPAAQGRLSDFLEGRGPKVVRSPGSG